MKARRSGRLRQMDALYRAVQRIRLERIADLTEQPLSPREHYFLWTLKSMGRVNYDDFIVSGLLFMAEREELRIHAGEEAGAVGEPAAPADVTAS